MKNFVALAVVAVTLAVYAGVIAFGGRVRPAEWFELSPFGPKAASWQMGRMSDVSADKAAEIRYGAQLFDETPVYGAAYVKSRISCSNCHLEGGIAPYASPMVGIASAFPMYSPRAKRDITLEDRVQECMTRSENGEPLPSDSREMKALLAYIGWLSEPHKGEKDFVGRGLKTLPAMQPNAAHGAEVYAAQCAGCHGVNGEGRSPNYPPLWGPAAFNDGAGMNGVEKMAAFVKYNMPHNRKGILSAQEAFDVAAFVHSQPRPAFNREYDHF